MRFDFGDIVLDDETRQLLRRGREVRLSPKAFDFLVVLIQARPRVVTKAELHKKIWSGVNVSDASVAMVASEARSALGESARAPHWIHTAHGHGYAFRGEIKSDAARPAATGSTHWLLIAGRVVPLHAGDNIVGREPGVDVWIDASTVSRRHACLTVDAGTVTVTDLESKNGTFVGDTDVRATAAIANGDELRFGSELAVFRESVDTTAPATAPPARRHR